MQHRRVNTITLLQRDNYLAIRPMLPELRRDDTGEPNALTKEFSSEDTVVDLAGEETKSGVSPDRARRLLEVVAGCENLRCVGLMTMPPFFDDPEGTRPYFSELRRLRDRLQTLVPQGEDLKGLSMGMSGDFEVAVEEGATFVRIGTALFGPRKA